MSGPRLRPRTVERRKEVSDAPTACLGLAGPQQAVQAVQGGLDRTISFFDGTGAGVPALTLAAWALAGLLVILVADRRAAHGPQPETTAS